MTTTRNPTQIFEAAAADRLKDYFIRLFKTNDTAKMKRNADPLFADVVDVLQQRDALIAALEVIASDENSEASATASAALNEIRS